MTKMDTPYMTAALETRSCWPPAVHKTPGNVYTPLWTQTPDHRPFPSPFCTSSALTLTHQKSYSSKYQTPIFALAPANQRHYSLLALTVPPVASTWMYWSVSFQPFLFFIIIISIFSSMKPRFFFTHSKWLLLKKASDQHISSFLYCSSWKWWMF